MENRSSQRAENRTGQFFNTGIAPHDAVHVEEVEDDHREDGIPGDKAVIGIQILRVDGGIITVKTEPQGQEVAEMGDGEVIDHGKEGNDLPMLNFFQDDPPPSKKC